MKHFRALKKIEVDIGGTTLRIPKGEVFALAGKTMLALPKDSFEECDISPQPSCPEGVIEPHLLNDVPLVAGGASLDEDITNIEDLIE